MVQAYMKRSIIHLGFAFPAASLPGASGPAQDGARSKETPTKYLAFEIAREKDIAAGFHIDDSVFWLRRKDLWSDPKNVEWREWKGTPNVGRRIDWGGPPRKLAPQMCLNSPAIQAEVRRLGRDVFGAAICAEVEKLRKFGKEDLFAGVVAGWETQMGMDFETGAPPGFAALTRRGFSVSYA